MSERQDFSKLRRKAEQAGWRFTVTGGNHLRAESPDGKKVVILSGSPGGGRALRNARADLRRAGLDI